MNDNIENIDRVSDGAPALSLRDLRSFVAIARAGGVTRAARQLGYAQGTLSTHLAALETALGVKLLAPERRGAPLTEAGRAVLVRAESLLREAAALRKAAQAVAGDATVRLAAVEPVASHRLPRLLADFARTRPDLHVELRVARHTEALALVDAGAVAFALAPRRLAPPRAAAPTSFTPLYDDPMLVLLPDRHRLAKAKHVDLVELAGESLLVGNDACAYRALIAGALRESDIEVALRARFGDASTLAYGVAAGLGIAVLPAGFFAGGLPTGTIAVPLRRPRIAIEIGLVQARRRDPEPEPERALRRALLDGLRAPKSKRPRQADQTSRTP
ncbi:MAG: LysR family transcriptional regulator [Vulcanimicrobiaceae bacterium]